MLQSSNNPIKTYRIQIDAGSPKWLASTKMMPDTNVSFPLYSIILLILTPSHLYSTTIFTIVTPLWLFFFNLWCLMSGERSLIYGVLPRDMYFPELGWSCSAYICLHYLHFALDFRTFGQESYMMCSEMSFHFNPMYKYISTRMLKIRTMSVKWSANLEVWKNMSLWK